jgi:hypothetical protein
MPKKSARNAKKAKARRRRSAVVAVKKDTTILQTDQGTGLGQQSTEAPKGMRKGMRK